jgi:ribosome-associated translation inhibitor RaiA
MQIQIHSQDPSLPAAFRTFAEEKISTTLQHLAERLTRVEVHFKDLNGQKGGIDKRCVMEARPRGMDPVVVEHDAAEAREALVHASGKLERALRTRFERLAEGR